MLRKLLSSYEPEYICVVFDAKGPTFRSDIYSEYKAHRPPMPDELRVQIEPLKQTIAAMGLSIISEPGVEADDVMATLAHIAAKQNHQVIISTSDKDMAQLVNDKITLIDTMKNATMDRKWVKNKFDVYPEQIIDYLALMGDSSDNIPGVPKVGPKTAAKWLNQYQTAEQIIENADAIKGKVGENLRANLDQLRMAMDLTTIRCDLPLNENFEDIKRQPENNAELSDLFREFEFKNWLEELNESEHTATPAAPAIATDYQTILTKEDFESWISRLAEKKQFSFDTETSGLDPNNSHIVGLSFACDSNSAAYVPVRHDYIGAPKQLPADWVFSQIKPLLENPENTVIMQNLKFDQNMLLNEGIEVKCQYQDTMLESYVLNSTVTRHDMDSLANHYLQRTTTSFEEVAGKGKNQLTFNQVLIETATPYAAEDAEITLALHQTLSAQLEETPEINRVYQEIEAPLIPVLARMERTGVLIDAKMLQQHSSELHEKLVHLEGEAYREAGETFNLASPKQIQAIFYEKLDLPVIKKTPKGQPSTSESVLQELATQHPLPRLILEHRSLAKLKQTYTDKLPLQISPKTGRIHTSYHQAVTATGRLSSSDPNLQNIPIRSDEGRRIRDAFIAEPGYTVFAADYSQIELRIMAHLSQDSGLLSAFAENQDIHRATAAEIFSVETESVTTDQRRSAKAINFGLIYGMSAFGLAKQLDTDRKTAQEYIDRYFDRYPGVKTYMDAVRAEAHQNKYVETLMGRRLYLAEIDSKNRQRREYAERAAINAPMQGTAADIIKLAMIDIDGWIQQQNPDLKMTMQVHDELVFEIRTEQLETLGDLIKQRMESVLSLDIPLIVDTGSGSNWGEAH